MGESSTHPERDPFAWREKAERDLELVRLVVAEMKGVDAFPSHVGFLCQQAIEKYLKLVIVASGEMASRTHDLQDLLDEACSFCPALEKFGDSLAWLTPFAAEMRYPQEDEIPPDEMNHAVKLATDVQTVVLDWLDHHSTS